MPKQEEIREGMANLIKENTWFTEGEYSPLAGPITSDTREMLCEPLDLAREILSYLHSQGVEIKVDRELPNIQFIKGNQAFVDIVKKAGYVATIPIIEE